MITLREILSHTRLRPSTKEGRNILTESESDRGRVLFCPAFRRLQQKAQVFSMEPNAAVRSRLTHSLEVSQIGRYIADLVAQDETLGCNSALDRGALVNFVETACLMHDIGNPPFGHFGEAAIRKWFEEKGSSLLSESINDLGFPDANRKASAALTDFREFDGNPQGLRIVTRLQWNTDKFGLNLTKTSLATFLKYVRVAGQSGTGLFQRKAGFFKTEEGIVAEVWKEFGYTTPQRFPLAYIMEAADDIAYCISDLEDSIEKGVIALDDALEFINRDYNAKPKCDSGSTHSKILNILGWMSAKKRDGKEFTYTDFRTLLTSLIVEYVAGRFAEHHAKVLDGTLDSLLPISQPPGAILETLKNYCRKHVYVDESIQLVELAGYNAIRGLLDQCSSLLSLSTEGFKAAREDAKEDDRGHQLVLEPKLLKLFPEKYLKVYDSHVEEAGNTDVDPFLEWNFRAHLVVDFISGMTDDFAMTTYRTLAGMRL